MAILYEKTTIDRFNKYGIKEVTDETPLKKGPCVIVVLAMTWFLVNVNGAMRLVANLINPDIDKVYDPNRRIFGLGFGEYAEDYEGFTAFKPENDELEKFVEKYFLPLVTDNGRRIKLLDAMKNVRNINIVTYCDAAKYFKAMEKAFEKMMHELTYSSTEIDMILSQICLASISGNALKQWQPKATTMAFGDINDKHFGLPFESPKISESYALINYERQLNFVVDGDGVHDFEKYMSDKNHGAEAVRLFISNALDNSIYNHNSSPFIPIDGNSIMENMLKELNKDGKHLHLYKS